MNVLDGVRHLNQSIMEEVGRQFGANGVEIDAHMLCAEDHLPYQGQQFSNEEFEDIQDSLDRPFGEWNCRHSWHGIILGVSPPTYTPDQLEKMQRYSTEQITVDGRTKTRYQWSQEMRRCETAVRQQKDAANLARATDDDALRRHCQGIILELNKYYEQLADKVGIGPEFQRTYVPGFKDVKNAEMLTSTVNGGTMNARGDEKMSSIQSPIEQRNTGKGNPSAVAHFERPLNNRQQAVLDRLPSFDSRTTIEKKDFALRDLAALTAKTGDEYAMFSRKGERMIVRGNASMTNITVEAARQMAAQGWKWSGHTHPGTDHFCLFPSDGDKAILEAFNQDESCIVNSLGMWITFRRDD